MSDNTKVINTHLFLYVYILHIYIFKFFTYAFDELELHITVFHYIFLIWITMHNCSGIRMIRAENSTEPERLQSLDRNSLTIGLVKSNYRKMEYLVHTPAYYRMLEIIEELKNVCKLINVFMYMSV